MLFVLVVICIALCATTELRHQFGLYDAVIPVYRAGARACFTLETLQILLLYTLFVSLFTLVAFFIAYHNLTGRGC